MTFRALSILTVAAALTTAGDHVWTRTRKDKKCADWTLMFKTYRVLDGVRAEWWSIWESERSHSTVPISAVHPHRSVWRLPISARCPDPIISYSDHVVPVPSVGPWAPRTDWTESRRRRSWWIEGRWQRSNSEGKKWTWMVRIQSCCSFVDWSISYFAASCFPSPTRYHSMHGSYYTETRPPKPFQNIHFSSLIILRTNQRTNMHPSTIQLDLRYG